MTPFLSLDDTWVMGYNQPKLKEKLIVHVQYTKFLFEDEL